MQLDLLRKRDVLNFMTWRDAGAADDRAVSQLLLATFTVTNAEKRPELVSTAERVRELNDVAGRRGHGVVRLVEIGARIVGTYALMRSRFSAGAAWRDGDAYLRAVAIDPQFQGLKLADSLLHDALAHARAWDERSLSLHVVAGSKGLARLYGSHGFERDAAGDHFAAGFELEGYRLVL